MTTTTEELQKTPGFLIDLFTIPLLWLGGSWLTTWVTNHYAAVFFLLVPIRLIAIAGGMYNYWENVDRRETWRKAYRPGNRLAQVGFWIGAAFFVLAFLSALGGGMFTLPVRLLRTMGFSEAWLGTAFWVNFFLALSGVGGFRFNQAKLKPSQKTVLTTFQRVIYPISTVLLFLLLEAMLKAATTALVFTPLELGLNVFFGVFALRLLIYFTPPFRLRELISMLIGAGVLLYRLLG